MQLKKNSMGELLRILTIVGMQALKEGDRMGAIVLFLAHIGY